MEPQCNRLRWLWWLVSVLAAFFFGTAAVGWYRERHDVDVMRVRYRRIEAELESKIEKVGDGVSLETFKEMLPSTYQDQESGEWVVSIVTDYSENPYCTNHFHKKVYFVHAGDIVKPVRDKSAVGCSHGDRFGRGGIWYYFGRAWYTTVEKASP